MKTIYLVRGCTGSYSDFRAWDVRAFSDEANAIALRDRLNAWCEAHSAHPGATIAEDLARDRAAKPEEDPRFKCDDGTEYGVFPVSFEGP